MTMSIKNRAIKLFYQTVTAKIIIFGV